jgi:hypothetical protein
VVPTRANSTRVEGGWGLLRHMYQAKRPAAGRGQALKRPQRAPRALPSGTVAPAPLAARERLRGRMTANTGLSNAGFGTQGRIWVCIAGGARWSAGALKLSWRSQIRIRARLDRHGSVLGKAVAAGHAPHPVVDGTRTTHILPSAHAQPSAK